MFTKRLLFTLIFVFSVLLAACTPAATPTTQAPTPVPTAVPTDVPTPELAPTTPLPDPITVVENYYAAVNAQDWDTAASYIADDVRWRGTPTLSGKDSFMSYIQGGNPADSLTEITDLRATKGRVTYTWTFYKNDNFQARGEDTVVVENGKIIAGESYAVMDSDVRPEMAEIVFTSSDSAFSGPDEIEGGWVKLSLTNEGQEGHHLQLVKLEEGKTLDELKEALTANPEVYPAWAIPSGGPNAPDPGGTTSAIVYLEAGSYALIDIIPNAEGVLHFQLGLLKGLTVTEYTGVMPGEPLPDVTVILSDFNFGMDGTPVAGEQTFRIRNAGSQVHELFIVKLDDGKTADDYLNTPLGEIPPAVSLGGITGINPGDGQYLRLTLEPGNYAMFCFLPDPASHAPHFTLGMVLEFTVP